MEEGQGRYERAFITKGLEIAFVHRSDSKSLVTKHWHDFYEIVYLLEGSLDIRTDTWEDRLYAGEMVVINPEVGHSFKNDHGNRGILIQIPKSVLKRCLKESDALLFDVPIRSDEPMVCQRLKNLKEIILQMKKIYEMSEEGYALKFESLLYEFLFELYQGFVRKKKTDFSGIFEGDIRLKKVIEYSEEHYTENISIEKISSLIHLQPQYFCRYFKKWMGKTYLEYVNELRIFYIYKDLLHTDQPLYQILEKHGFKNKSLFRRMFKEKFNCTPKELRLDRRQVDRKGEYILELNFKEKIRRSEPCGED